MSTAFHPQTDGQTERVNRTLEQMLRMYVCPTQSDWDTYLPLVEYAYNSAVQETSQQTPFEVVYGFTPPDPLAAALHAECPAVQDRLARAREIQQFVAERLQVASHRLKARLDRSRRDVSFVPGAQVLLSTTHLRLKESNSSKLRLRWVGPFSVVRAVGPVAFELALPAEWKIHPVFHASLLKPFVSPSVFPPHSPTRPPPILVDGHPEWYVEKIVGEKFVDGVRFLKVKWLGYSAAEDSWEPVATLEDCVALDVWERSWRPF